MLCRTHLILTVVLSAVCAVRLGAVALQTSQYDEIQLNNCEIDPRPKQPVESQLYYELDSVNHRVKFQFRTILIDRTEAGDFYSRETPVTLAQFAENTIIAQYDISADPATLQITVTNGTDTQTYSNQHYEGTYDPLWRQDNFAVYLEQVLSESSNPDVKRVRVWFDAFGMSSAFTLTDLP